MSKTIYIYPDPSDIVVEGGEVEGDLSAISRDDETYVTVPTGVTLKVGQRAADENSLDPEKYAVNYVEWQVTAEVRGTGSIEFEASLHLLRGPVSGDDEIFRGTFQTAFMGSLKIGNPSTWEIRDNRGPSGEWRLLPFLMADSRLFGDFSVSGRSGELTIYQIRLALNIREVASSELPKSGDLVPLSPPSELRPTTPAELRTDPSVGIEAERPDDLVESPLIIFQ